LADVLPANSSQDSPPDIRRIPYDTAGSEANVIGSVVYRSPAPVLATCSAVEGSGCPSYEIASALIAETNSVCGGYWWTGLFRGGLHSA